MTVSLASTTWPLQPLAAAHSCWRAAASCTRTLPQLAATNLTCGTFESEPIRLTVSNSIGPPDLRHGVTGARCGDHVAVSPG
jgi:hypothetical protein